MLDDQKRSRVSLLHVLSQEAYILSYSRLTPRNSVLAVPARSTTLPLTRKPHFNAQTDTKAAVLPDNEGTLWQIPAAVAASTPK